MYIDLYAALHRGTAHQVGGHVTARPAWGSGTSCGSARCRGVGLGNPTRVSDSRNGLDRSRLSTTLHRHGTDERYDFTIHT